MSKLGLSGHSSMTACGMYDKSMVSIKPATCKNVQSNVQQRQVLVSPQQRKYVDASLNSSITSLSSVGPHTHLCDLDVKIKRSAQNSLSFPLLEIIRSSTSTRVRRTLKCAILLIGTPMYFRQSLPVVHNLA